MTQETGTPEAVWYQALRLRERLPSSADLPFDQERAGKRLERWRAQAPFSKDGFLDRRLAADGLGQAELLALLGEDPEHLRQRRAGIPAWLREIQAAYADGPGDPLPWPGEHDPKSGGSAAFLLLVEPLVRRSRERLRQAIAELDPPGGLEIDADLTIRDLLTRLAPSLRHYLARTLVLELQVARLEERLQGETPEQRFWSFIETLREPATAREVLARYPVLARHVVEHLARWEETALEMLRRLIADWAEIRRRFGFFGPEETDPGLLVELESGQGDPHRGGRSVYLLRFASGFRLVYKPKSLAVDVAFQDLLHWLNRRGFEPDFRLLGVLDRGPYGWLEFVEARPCLSPEEVRRFYQRQGAFLALLYLLEATDFHHENLIASGEHPVLVDLETLFHPEINRRELRPFAERPDTAGGDWVLRIGLLPQRVWGDAEQPGVDLSGLAAAGGAGSISYWGTVGATTDEMHMGPKQIDLPATSNRPSLEGQEVSFLEHADDIFDGFRRLYGLLWEHREELTSAAGPLAAFADAEVRVVFRPTRAYFGLYVESFHPYSLGSALDRARFLDRVWAGVEERPFLAPLAILEHRDLEIGDIPFFATRPGTRDLWTSSGERIPDFFPETGLDRAARRLARFGDADRERQEWLIRGSFSTVRMQLGSNRPGYAFRESAAPATREQLLDAARAAADRLAALAFEEDGRAQWLSVEYLSSGGWEFRQVQPDFYLGLPGIAFALGYLGDLLGEERYSRLARLALASQRRILEERPDAVSAIGAFNGWGGLIYALTHLGVLWNDAALLDEAEALALRLGPEIERDEHSDIIVGAAGFLMALLGLHQVRPSDPLWQLALRCGERLLERAQPMERGRGWVVAITGPTPISGMSHGAAGIALALLWLARQSGDERFRRTALAALEYERSLYSPRHRNWPDLRQGAKEMAEEMAGPGEEGLYVCSWCHGAPGIGLARTAGLPFLDDLSESEAVRDEIRVAVETTLAEGFGKNHCLCHGDLGNLDLVGEAARATGDRGARGARRPHRRRHPRQHQGSRLALRPVDRRGAPGPDGRPGRDRLRPRPSGGAGAPAECPRPGTAS